MPLLFCSTFLIKLSRAWASWALLIRFYCFGPGKKLTQKNIAWGQQRHFKTLCCLGVKAGEISPCFLVMEDLYEEYGSDENADLLPLEPVEDDQHRNGIVSEEDEGEEDEDEDEDDDDEEEQEEDGEDGEEEEHVPVEQSPRASQDGPSTSNEEVIVLDEPENCVEDEGNKRRRIEGEKACSSQRAESSQGNEWDRNDIEGLFCPICMDAWTNNGEHHIWCEALSAYPRVQFLSNYVLSYSH